MFHVMSRLQKYANAKSKVRVNNNTCFDNLNCIGTSKNYVCIADTNASIFNLVVNRNVNSKIIKVYEQIVD